MKEHGPWRGGDSATVWIALTTGPALAQTPEVELNHVYVTLSKGTIDAISGSTVLSGQFSTPEARTVKSGNESWTGTYLMGWRAYLELFAPDGAEGYKGGDSGIGFSVPRPGSGEAVKEGWVPFRGSPRSPISGACRSTRRPVSPGSTTFT